MAILENRVKQYSKNKGGLLKTLNFSLARIASILTLVMSVGLVINSNFLSINSAITDFNGFIYSRIVNPADRFISNGIKLVVNIVNFDRLHTENISLKIEQDKLIEEIEKARSIKIENNNLKKLTKLVEVSDKDPNVRAQVIYHSSSENDYLAVIEGGQKNGINKNDIVISNGTLAGRIVTVGKNYSQISLVNSYNSRIPVRTVNTTLKAILVGGADKGGYLVHLQGGQKPSVGELIVTSGDGNYFPKNIPVAKVKQVVDDNIIVEFLCDLTSADFVEILNPNNIYN